MAPTLTVFCLLSLEEWMQEKWEWCGKYRVERKSYLGIYLFNRNFSEKAGSLPSSFLFTWPLKIEGAKYGTKCSLRRSWRKYQTKKKRKYQTDGASKDKLPGFSWVEDSNSPSHNTSLQPSRPGQNTQDKLHRELQQTWGAPLDQESKSVSYTRTYFSRLLATLRQYGTPGLWDARWEWRILMGGSCPTHIDRWSHFFFLPDKDMHTSPRTIVAMTTAEVKGEQVSGTACFLNSRTRPEAAVTQKVEKFMLAVLLNGFPQI